MKLKTLAGIILIPLTLIITGFFPLTPSVKDLEQRFLTEDVYQKNLTKRVKQATRMLKELKYFEEADSKAFKIKYFFSTDQLDKAKNLFDEISTLEGTYSVEYGKDKRNKNRFIITGLTDNMVMSEEVVIEWTKKMCALGYGFDCALKRWELTSDQDQDQD
jgi:hypothetical protein